MSMPTCIDGNKARYPPIERVYTDLYLAPAFFEAKLCSWHGVPGGIQEMVIPQRHGFEGSPDLSIFCHSFIYFLAHGGEVSHCRSKMTEPTNVENSSTRINFTGFDFHSSNSTLTPTVRSPNSISIGISVTVQQFLD